MNGLLLGVDGGNTKTAAVVVDPGGAVLGAGARGAGHPQRGLARARPGRDRAGCDRCARRRRRRRRPRAAAFSLAGADWPEDFERLRRAHGEVGLATNPGSSTTRSRARCGSDELGRLGRDRPACRGRRPQRGRDGLPSGFWPEKTGAFALGSMALAAVWRHMLGLGHDASCARARALGVRGCAGAPARSRGSAVSTSRSPAASPTRSSTRRRRATASRSRSSRRSRPDGRIREGLRRPHRPARCALPARPLRRRPAPSLGAPP